MSLRGKVDWRLPYSMWYIQVTVISVNIRMSNAAFMWSCIVTNFFIIKPNKCTNFTNLFWHETTHVSDCSSVHHQEFIHCTLSNGIWHTGLQTAFDQEHMLLIESCLQTYITYNIAECTVNKILMMDRRTVRNM